MASSAVPEVPWTSRVESPEMAAARCSDTQVLAVPGTPSSSSARSVASVATATSISRRGPMYLGVMTVPSAQRAAQQVGDHGLRRQPPRRRPGPVVGRGQGGQLVRRRPARRAGAAAARCGAVVLRAVDAGRARRISIVLAWSRISSRKARRRAMVSAVWSSSGPGRGRASAAGSARRRSRGRRWRAGCGRPGDRLRAVAGSRPARRPAEDGEQASASHPVAARTRRPRPATRWRPRAPGCG